MVFFSRQSSGDSGQSETTGNHAYPLTLKNNINNNENESDTDTHVSRLSSGISFGSTVTDDINFNSHPKEFLSRVSFGSLNTDDHLPMILSEEDGNRMSMDNCGGSDGDDNNDDNNDGDDIHDHSRAHNPSLDTECEGIGKRNEQPLVETPPEKKSSLPSAAKVSTEGSILEQKKQTENRSGCLIQ